jgi:hypothetical protein
MLDFQGRFWYISHRRIFSFLHRLRSHG